MICRGCFWDLNREEIKAEFEAARQKEADEQWKEKKEEKQGTLEHI